jgi:radical SAM superfamily enzyme YgiQ (UPF0313 family)
LTISKISKEGTFLFIQPAAGRTLEGEKYRECPSVQKVVTSSPYAGLVEAATVLHSLGYARDKIKIITTYDWDPNTEYESNIKRIFEQNNIVAVFFAILSIDSIDARRLIKMIRTEDAKVMLMAGSFEALAFPEKCLGHGIDLLIRGDAELVLPKLLGENGVLLKDNDQIMGCLKNDFRGIGFKDGDEFFIGERLLMNQEEYENAPFPDYSLVENLMPVETENSIHLNRILNQGGIIKRHLVKRIVYVYSKFKKLKILMIPHPWMSGCSFSAQSCGSFCLMPKVTGGTPRFRKPKKIAEDLVKLKKSGICSGETVTDMIMVTGDMINANLPWLLETLRAIVDKFKSENITPPTWVGQFRVPPLYSYETGEYNIDVEKETIDMLKLMAESNCKTICPGFESGNQRVLDSINKKLDVRSSHRFIELIRKYCPTTYIYAYLMAPPTATYESIRDTYRLADKCDYIQWLRMNDLYGFVKDYESGNNIDYAFGPALTYNFDWDAVVTTAYTVLHDPAPESDFIDAIEYNRAIFNAASRLYTVSKLIQVSIKTLFGKYPKDSAITRFNLRVFGMDPLREYFFGKNQISYMKACTAHAKEKRWRLREKLGRWGYAKLLMGNYYKRVKYNLLFS